jgi:hypothetical protein
LNNINGGYEGARKEKSNKEKDNRKEASSQKEEEVIMLALI